MWHLLLVLLLTPIVFSQRLTEKENAFLQKICGMMPQSRSTRSMHTPQVARAAAPWVVRMERTTNWVPNITMEERKNRPYCTGSLISPRHVLTAAHCLVNIRSTWFLLSSSTPKGDVLTVKYDPFNIAKHTVHFTESCELDSCKWGGSFKDIHVPVKKVFVSNNWTGDPCVGSDVLIRGDVAVLELAEDVPYSKHVYPACLNSKDLKQEEKIEQFGYGTGPSVTEADQDLNELKTRNFKAKVDSCGHFSPPDVFCFQDALASLWDSGSGMFVYDEEKRVRVVAPASGIMRSCNETLKLQMLGPGFATLVKPNLYWICAATGICLNGLEQFKIYNEKGLTDTWYKTFEPLTGTDIYV